MLMSTSGTIIIRFSIVPSHHAYCINLFFGRPVLLVLSVAQFVFCALYS